MARPSFDLATDFSPSQNPNGPWSFWWTSSSNGFNLYTFSGTAFGLPLEEWRGPFPNDNGSSPPNVIRNPTDLPITVSDTTWLPHRVTFHPGHQGEQSVIRWTSPLTGEVRVEAELEGRSGFVTSGIEFYKNITTKLLSAAVLGSGSPSRVSFVTNLVVQVGDSFDVRVNYGNDNWTSDTTQISLRIASVTNPTLTLSLLSNGSARLAWPTSPTGYALESTSELETPVWMPVTNALQIQGDEFCVVIDTSNQQRFFRLRRLQ